MYSTTTDRESIRTAAGHGSRSWLSFVIPAKEEGLYIERSLLHLTAIRDRYTLDFDVIVVDGGSSDDTIAKASLADRVVVDSHLALQSIGHGRNVGARHTNAELLFHTDADVIVPELPRFLAEIARVFSDSSVVAATTRILPYPWEATRTDRVMHCLFNSAIRAAVPLGARLAKGECQIVRRSAFEAVGGYEGSIVVGEDCDLFHRLSRIGKVVYFKNFCVYHSPRRFRALGYRRVLAMYGREAVSLTLRNRSSVQEWEVVR